MHPSRSRSASGPASGYYFQLERILARLSEVDANGSVAIEKEDDVSVHFEDGTLYLEQDKHTLGERDPFGPGSSALWKTLDIWTKLVESGKVDTANTHFFLVTNALMSTGLATEIAGASEKSADLCLALLRKIGLSVSESAKKYAHSVLGRDDSLLKSVLIRVQSIDASASSAGASLRRKTASNLHLPDDVDEIDVLNALHGWIATGVLENWRQGRPAIVPRRAFDRQLHRLINQFRTFKKFGMPEHLVRFAIAEREKHLAMRYVKQLVLIDAESSEVIDAIDDFIRCSIERLRLGKEGDLTPDDWADFEGVLTHSWKNIRRREIKLATDLDEKLIGYKILSDTRDVSAELGGQSAHPYVIKGTYHRFSDIKAIGWHPRFIELL
jgi:hypothetical protein